jgi:NAD(P)-dependent dehydrogenase (short-subunit alcohol dehydrogenase family)
MGREILRAGVADAKDRQARRPAGPLLTSLCEALLHFRRMRRDDHPENRKHVLITGTSTGIGRECALYLARKGFVVLAAARRESDAPVVETVGYQQICPLRLDVTDGDSIAAAAQRVREVVGSAGLCGLVNNAGIGVLGPIEFVPIDGWRKQFEVNVFGQVMVTQAMLPLLRDHVARFGHGSARIINITSIGGRLAQPILGPYTASKFALEAISDSLRFELRRQGIRICVIQPGAVQSEIWRKGEEQTMNFPSDGPARKLYAQVITGVQTIAKQASKTAVPADRVAEVVEKCLTKRRPRTRYLIGKDAKSAAFFQSILPTTWFDAIMTKVMKI